MAVKRVVMLAARIFSWRGPSPGTDENGKIILGPLIHKAPAIGEIVDVPDEVLAELDEGSWAPALPGAQLGEQPEPRLATAERGAPGGAQRPPPTPHLAAKVQ